MSSSLVSTLHLEERSLVAELRASKPFQRLEGIRRLLALYDAQPSVATGLDTPATAAAGEVIQLTPAMAVATPEPAIPLPAPIVAAAPVAAAAPIVAAAEAAVADAMRGPSPAMVAADAAAGESASVVSSVRAALLGIGKG
jgi:Meckel syndrome type 1 protein